MMQAKTAQLLNHTPALGFRHKSYSSQWCLRPRPPVKPTQIYRDDPLRSPRNSRKGNNHRRKPGAVKLDLTIHCFEQPQCDMPLTGISDSTRFERPPVI